ncbi:uncharacterized protein LOC114846210 [Betta splendens]|uniref:Uncharacterized protein LOC114846210 n=1 Tax=Betta splendens TaxID=158456 RepID=A0A6P7L8R6_BETSP|nr:uncharacterized protein LOC114846210 [Betta splendens]
MRKKYHLQSALLPVCGGFCEKTWSFLEMLSTFIAEPEQEQGSRKEPETEREDPKPRADDPSLALVEFRIQQLQNRLLILQNAQEVKKKAADGAETAEEESPATCDLGDEGCDEGCELEEVQQELEELQVTKTKLEKRGKSSRSTGHQGSYEAKTPHRGIYTLPDPHLQHFKPMPTADQIIPVEHLGKMPMFTRCPSCGALICTEIQRKTSETMWLLCCVLSMVGCVAGCCLMPFFMEGLKKVCHYCPNCQAKIHIHRPL